MIVELEVTAQICSCLEVYCVMYMRIKLEYELERRARCCDWLFYPLEIRGVRVSYIVVSNITGLS